MFSFINRSILRFKFIFRKEKFNPTIQTKLASKYAKEKRFDDAIDCLHQIYKKGFGSESNIIKILPYYQKAGRYHEICKFVKKTAIPLIEKERNTMFKHRCREMRDAFFFLSMSRLYSKMALCAEREGNSKDFSRYVYKAKNFGNKYERLIEIGGHIEWDKGKKEILLTFGSDPTNWPLAVKEEYDFDSFIEYKEKQTIISYSPP